MTEQVKVLALQPDIQSTFLDGDYSKCVYLIHQALLEQYRSYVVPINLDESLRFSDDVEHLIRFVNPESPLSLVHNCARFIQSRYRDIASSVGEERKISENDAECALECYTILYKYYIELNDSPLSIKLTLHAD